MDKTTAKPAQADKKPKEAEQPAMTMTAAFIEFQKQLPAIRKDKKGNYGEYSSLDEILSKAKPVLNRLGFGIMQVVYTGDDGGYWLKTQLPYIHGGVLESGALKLPTEGVGAQKLGSAMTYSKRYQLAAFLGVNIDEDDDAQLAQDAATAAETQGMLAKDNVRIQYTQWINAIAQKLGLPVRNDLDTLTTPELIKEAQEAKQKLADWQATQGAQGAVANGTA